MDNLYRNQVALLLKVLPEVPREDCFALHGGTAINLFVRNMPRLSVDIDLTYIPIEDRETSLRGIADALFRLRENIRTVIPGAHIEVMEDISKMTISAEMAQIKLEVNQVGRGLIGPPVEMPLCGSAQVEFDAFCTVKVVPVSQLFGGKMCAALDRQHPRDFFDIKYLLEQESVTDQIMEGFLLSLLGSGRPTHELIDPNLLDQRRTFEQQFSGMTREPFTYQEFEKTRQDLIDLLRAKLTKKDRSFLVSFNSLEPEWSVYDFSRFPSIRWKLINLEKLRSSNPKKFKSQLDELRRKLGV